MTNGVKTRGLTPYVMICNPQQNTFVYQKKKKTFFCILYTMTNGVKTRGLTPYVMICTHGSPKPFETFLQFIDDDIWCQTSSFDIICHDM